MCVYIYKYIYIYIYIYTCIYLYIYKDLLVHFLALIDVVFLVRQCGSNVRNHLMFLKSQLAIEFTM